MKGCTQQAGVDYIEKISPIMKMITVRALIGTTVVKGWEMYQLDVNNAFLHGYLHKEVYIQVPQGRMVTSMTLCAN